MKSLNTIMRKNMYKKDKKSSKIFKKGWIVIKLSIII